MPEDLSLPIACSVCEVSFTIPRRRRAGGRATLTEIWADGERVVMICEACRPAPGIPSPPSEPDMDGIELEDF